MFVSCKVPEVSGHMTVCVCVCVVHAWVAKVVEWKSNTTQCVCAYIAHPLMLVFGFRWVDWVGSMRARAMTLTLSVCLISLLMIVGWIGQESKLYDDLLRYQRQLQSYRDHCLETGSSRERFGHKRCPLGFILLQGRCSQCGQGTFSLLQWTSCAKFLTCDDFTEDVRPTSVLWRTDQWEYIEANWNTYRVIYSQKIVDGSPDNDSSSEFDVIWRTAADISPHKNVLYPAGACVDEKRIVYGVEEDVHPLTQLDSLLAHKDCDNWVVRFKLAIDYMRLLRHLHLHPSGPYVLCNSHSLQTLVSQFAVSEHLNLLLANFANLPAGHQPIVCSRKELSGSFIAPEQSWPYSHYKVFNPDEQPGYFYSSDIWKVPDFTRYLLGTSTDSEKILNYLIVIHHRCKSRDYLQRPSAEEILTEYESVWDAMVGDYDSPKL